MFLELQEEVIVYKKARDISNKEYLITLLLPRGTIVCSDVFSHQMRIEIKKSLRGINNYWTKENMLNYCKHKQARSDYAEVIKIQEINKNPKELWLRSFKLGKCVNKVNHVGIAGAAIPLTYEVGLPVVPHNFSYSNTLCTSGIHFYPSKKTAMETY